MAKMSKKKTNGKKTSTGSPKKKTNSKKVATANKVAKTKKGASVSPPASTKELKVGQKAPSFSLPNQDGKIVSLSDYKGKKVVLYFYRVTFGMGLTRSMIWEPRS